MVATQENKFQLPISIVSPTDVARLTREIELIDDYFRQQSIRNPGETNSPPRLSKLMDQLVSENQMNLLNESDRSRINGILKTLLDSAPVLHVSFSVDPPGSYVQKIVDWLRQHIHAYVLVTVGLQPNIGAGCVVRTTNKMFDFSLREYFNQKREFFIEKLHSTVFETNQDASPQDSPIVEVVASSQTQVQQSPVAENAVPAQQSASAEAPQAQPATPIDVQKANVEVKD